jgi:hypothetical protein
VMAVFGDIVLRRAGSPGALGWGLEIGGGL